MRSIEQVSCSLNLGFIYSIDYSYSPKEGINMKLYFVREDGSVANYIPPTPLQKVHIQVGGASFGMYPVAAGTELAGGRRVQWVEFEDDFFKLKKYWVALPGRGCGTNVFILGTPVDNRTDDQKVASAVDPIAQQIKDLTQFPDYEYSFNSFLSILRAKFPVSVISSFNGTITQAFEGSFLDVLNDWCNYYNLSFFLENGGIKIFDPSKLVITFPAFDANMISYETEHDIRSTYGKTVCNWFQQDGGEYPLSQTSNGSGPIQVATNTLFPAGYEFGLSQQTVDLNQVGAAMRGQNYWFLYNYYQGTTSEQCGWMPISSTDIVGNPSILQSVSALNGSLVQVIPGVADERFAAYQQYGQNIAGRWYLSNRSDDLSIDQTYSWFNETDGQITNFTGVEDKAIQLTYLTPPGGGAGVIDGTYVNTYFSGINYVGNRVVYKDDYQADLSVFDLGPLQGLVDSTYQALVGMEGSSAMDFSSVSTAVSGAQVLAHQAITIPQDISSTFANVTLGFTGFAPRFPSIPVKGIRSVDYASLKSAQNEPDGINIVRGNGGPNVVTNTSVLKTEQRGSYSVYYDKYSQCAYSSTPDAYYDFRFDPRQVSTDNQIGVTFSKLSNNTYNLIRDYGFISNLVNNPYLPQLALARTFPTKRVSFSLNYFYPVPINFLTAGLVGMSVSVGENGVTSSYSFSNEVLQVPDRSALFNQIAQNMRNTWTRTYRPPELLT